MVEGDDLPEFMREVLVTQLLRRRLSAWLMAQCVNALYASRWDQAQAWTRDLDALGRVPDGYPLPSHLRLYLARLPDDQATY